uniref:Amino acid permease/ SLC12A domain-containing protein n=1 Tax=Panagrolaimus sp. JU765 TaxID=591449 RepID=A0AC34PU84_9BILA
MSFYNPLANIGIFTAILSSALLCFISGPKVLQAICKDKLFPYITYFGEEYGNTGEPRKGYILTFFMVCIIVMIGDLNTIAPIISNFYLCTYVLVNFACFDTTLAKSPGFRPTFKFYNHWISLIGSLLCLCVMFIISWINALITFIFFGLLYFYMDYRKPDVNWGSSSQAHSYLNALNYVQKLEKIDEHVKNYRPQILVLTGNPAIRPSLIDFAY